MTQDQKYLLGLSLIPGLGPIRIKALLEVLTPSELWKLNQKSIDSLPLPQDVKHSLKTNRTKLSLDLEIEKLHQSSIEITTLLDPTYPVLLKQIPDPPSVLYFKGSLDPDSLKLAIVGTRLVTSYGKQVTQLLTSQLAAAGLTIVSGLAKGVDAVAHQTALEVGAKTIAVLGSGLNNIYPSENLSLARQVMQHGAVVSEYPPNFAPSKGSFPARNRIISGLCSGVLITEAGADSGSLITSQAAAEQGRLVFSVPGSILSKQSVGSNGLIKDGVKPVSSAADILDELNLSFQATEMKEISADNEAEMLILNQLGLDPSHFDELVKSTGMRAHELGSTLTVMVISGKVAELGGSFYARKR